MVVHLSLFPPQRVLDADAVLIGSMKTISHLVSVDQNLHKRNEEIKHEPIVHHLDAACLWQTRAHSNKHGGQDQHDLIQRENKKGGKEQGSF